MTSWANPPCDDGVIRATRGAAIGTWSGATAITAALGAWALIRNSSA